MLLKSVFHSKKVNWNHEALSIELRLVCNMSITFPLDPQPSTSNAIPQIWELASWRVQIPSGYKKSFFNWKSSRRNNVKSGL